MYNLLITILLSIIIGIASVGLSDWWQYAIHPERIFSKVGILAARLNESKNFLKLFIGKSLGACSYCNRERFKEIVFILVCLNLEMRWYNYFLMFMLSTGFSVLAKHLLTRPKKIELKKNIINP